VDKRIEVPAIFSIERRGEKGNFARDWLLPWIPKPMEAEGNGIAGTPPWQNFNEQQQKFTSGRQGRLRSGS